MFIYIGSYYIFLGIIFLFLPLIFIEFGRPRDLIKSGLYLFVGVILITKYDIQDKLFNLLIFCISFLVAFHVFEIFSFRYNLLTDQEKNKLRSFVEIKNNVSKFLQAFILVFKNFSETKSILKNENKNSTKKKWVRNDKNANILSSDKDKLITIEMKKTPTNQPEKDIIKETKF